MRLISVFGALLVFALAMTTVPDEAKAQSPSRFTTIDSVLVVPNPYNTSGRTFGPTGAALERISFRNLPAPSTIRIYTSAGNHVITLEHTGETDYPFIGGSLADQFTWTGRNKDNQYVNSDIYLYVVDSPDYGTTIGKLVVIR